MLVFLVILKCIPVSTPLVKSITDTEFSRAKNMIWEKSQTLKSDLSEYSESELYIHCYLKHFFTVIMVFMEKAGFFVTEDLDSQNFFPSNVRIKGTCCFLL